MNKLMRVPDEEGLVQAMQPFLPLALVGEHEEAALECWVAALEVRGYRGVELDTRSLSHDEARRWRHDIWRNDAGSLGWGTSLWLLDEAGQRVGMAQLHWGAPYVDVGLLYVHPDHRGRGVGRRLLTGAAAYAVRQGLWGAVVRTQWTWPHAWRAYRAMGLWLLHFKRDLVFVSLPEALPPRLVETDQRLELWRGEELLAWAVRSPDGRELLELESVEVGDVPADSTFAVELAFRGWPLQGEDVELGSPSSDGGLAPAALAWRIDRWLAGARERGWLVPEGLPDPPRPGASR